MEGSLVIEAGNGESRRLILTPASSAMQWLDGHLVEVEGRSRPGAIRVDRWTVTEGRHSMPAWVGEVQDLGDRLGLYVAASSVTYPFDASSSEDLAAYVGREVLVEGWIDVVQGLHVAFYRPLFDEGTRGESPSAGP